MIGVSLIVGPYTIHAPFDPLSHVLTHAITRMKSMWAVFAGLQYPPRLPREWSLNLAPMG
jgi:hypothetical protein